jgi:NADP-dependent 3-hydroxy acid dehydrogenase YdfG
MALGLQGTAALVTGASSGIGEATARDLAARGAAVALVARRKDRFEALAAQITSGGGTALAVQADVTEQDEAVAAVEEAVRAWGRLDILVNNAGAALSGRIVRKGAAVYRATKHALNAYSESLRQEVAGRYVRVSVVEPAAVHTGLFSSEQRRRDMAESGGNYERLTSEDVADAISYVTRPRHVAVGELLVRPTGQER